MDCELGFDSQRSEFVARSKLAQLSVAGLHSKQVHRSVVIGLGLKSS